jgi:tetratricopeptide (TPR) repeat protein
MLLVLDNFEHLMDGVDLLPRLLDAAPGVKLLITSRARLNLVEEWLLPLGGMALPPEEARKAALEDYSGTALFLACTSRLWPDYVPTSQEAAEIVRICRLLEGMPLGIELAAARSRTMPVRDIAANVAQGLDVLTTTIRDLPARHRSMAAAFDASWRLLTLRERHTLCCASVFRGGFTPEAAAAVTGATTHDLEELADSCWLRVEADGRWGMHELIRQYCEAKLRSEPPSGAGEGEGEVRARHVAYFRSFVLQKGETCLWNCGEALQETQREYGNLLAAWDGFVAQNDLQALRGVTGDFNWLADRLAWWASASRLYESSLRRLRAALELEVNDRDERRRLELALAWLLILRTDMQMRLGRLDDASAGLTEAEAMLGEGAPEDEDWGPTHLMLLRAWATTRFMQGNYADAMRGFREMLDDFHAVRVSARALPLHNSLYWEAEACWIMSLIGLYEGRYEEAIGWAQRSIQIARELGSELCEITAERPLAMCLTALGRLAEAERLLKRMLRTARRLGERYVTTQVLNYLGHLYYAKGQPGLARIWAQRCATSCQELNLVEQTLPSALGNLAMAELELDHVAAARHHCQRGLAYLEQSGGTHLPEYASLIVVMGWVALAEDDVEAATAHARRALATGSRMANATTQAVLLIAVALRRQGQTEHAAELASAVARSPLTSYATRERAAAALRELESRLPPEVYAAAVARGEGREVNELVLSLLTPAEETGPVEL